MTEETKKAYIEAQAEMTGDELKKALNETVSKMKSYITRCESNSDDVHAEIGVLRMMMQELCGDVSHLHTLEAENKVWAEVQKMSR